MDEWTETTLGQFASLQRGHDLPDTVREAGNVPVMGSFGITGFHSIARAKGPGVTVGRSGASIGIVSYIECDYWPLNTCLYVTDFHSNNPRYVYYLLSTLNLASFNSGSAQPSLNRNFIHPIVLTVPKRREQDEVVALLGALDDKIELNRRMNATLEAMARAIFKDWFVDFGPTRAKAEGRAPYLAPDLWALFPDALDDDDKPVGWEFGTLGELTEIQNGYAFKSADWQEAGVPVVKIGSVKPSVVDLENVSFVSEQIAADKSSFRLRIGDALVGLTGYVGEVGRVPPTDTPPLLNQRVGRFRPHVSGDAFSALVYTCVRDPSFKTFAEGKAHGSAQPNVSTKDLLSYHIILPPQPLIDAFENIGRSLFNKALANLGESRTLAQTRDLLLPRLMSGEIRLRDAERTVEAVA